VARSRSGFCISVATELDYSPASPWRLLCFFEETMMCVHAGGSAGAVLPVVPRWRPPRVASSRPRGHCPAMPPRQAHGRTSSMFFLSSTPLFSTPAMVFGHLGMTSEPSSQILLCVAAAGCMLVSVSCDCAIPCDNLLAPLFPLLAYLLTEVLFWTLHFCKIQLTLAIS
jgi:hypothetical protein